MTVKIAGCWELAWQAPLNEYELWIHPMREFDIEELNMVPITGISKSRVNEYNDITEILALYEDMVHVYVDESAEETLDTFIHPENALYVMGKTSFSPYLTHKRPQDMAVKIQSVKNTGGFWSHQAAAIILYDRYIKGL